jgi:hypothetical protein
MKIAGEEVVAPSIEAQRRCQPDGRSEEEPQRCKATKKKLAKAAAG